MVVHMYASFTRAPFQSALVLVVTLVSAVWWLTVPNLLATSTFLAVCAVIAASVWVVMTTWENARPASSLAQSLHDETAAAVTRGRDRAGEQ
jgi:hypothetical protein